MNVVIDGVEYAPRHKADLPHGAIKSLAKQMLDGRKHQGWTIAQAADECGVKPNTIVQAECGTISLKNAVTLADAYGIPLEQIARAVRRMRK